MNKHLVFAIALICFLPINAFAACTSPAGVAGEMGYDVTSTDKYQYCDGTNWVDMIDGNEISGPTTGLIHYWRLDETSGTTATDSVGSNNGTMSGGLNGTDTIVGMNNSALTFNGTSDFINLSPALNPYMGSSSNYTMSLWFNSSNLTSLATLYSEGKNSTTDYYYETSA